MGRLGDASLPAITTCEVRARCGKTMPAKTPLAQVHSDVNTVYGSGLHLRTIT